jgi:hypothetical protein
MLTGEESSECLLVSRLGSDPYVLTDVINERRKQQCAFRSSQ